LLGDVATVPGAGELGQRGPSLPVPADVLAFVQADRAVVAGRGILHPAGPADRKVGTHNPGIAKRCCVAGPGALLPSCVAALCLLPCAYCPVPIALCLLPCAYCPV